MNLFGAATSGVDPQTGSYLSKEQRVAMFQASRGNGRVGGANNGAQRAQVAPQNAIVVANKFAEITQTLSKNYESASAGVAQQVEENRKGIENLYRIIERQREDTLKAEKAETRSTLIQAENKRRNLKENFIEGISGAAAAAVAPLQKAAAAATKPLMSLWDKIRNALLLLAAAWAIDNLPTIIKKFNEYFGDLNKLKETVIKALAGLRGVFSIFDGIIRSVTRIIGGVIKTAFKVGKFIVKSAVRIASAVFGAIKKVVGTVVNAIFSGIRKLVGGAVDAYNGIRGMLPGGNKPTTPKLPGDKPPKNIFQRMWGKVSKAATGLKDFAGNQYSKLKEGANKFMTGFTDLRTKAMEKLNPIQAQATKDGIERGTNESREKGVKSLLTRILEKAGIKGGKGLMNNPVLKRLLKLPGIGIAIDVILNKAGGQGVAESLIRGFSSGIAGMVGMKAGAAVGAGVGTIAIPIPGVGTAVGGILGGLIGSILAANTADALAKAGMESAGMETTSNEEMTNNIGAKVDSIVGNNNSSTAGQSSPAAAITPSTPSTPDGMQTPAESNTTNNVNVQQLPATMEKIESGKKEVLPEQTPPAISTRDPQTDIYRAMASKNYQLTLEGAF